jgi:hypothetical protein
MSILESIQQQIADQLSAQPFFADIPVLVEHRADIQSEYERALGPVQVAGGRNGVCITILTPTADCAHPEIAGPFFDDIIIVALVQENVPANRDPVNGTGKSALTVCENLAAALDQFYPLAASAPIVPLKPTIVRGRDNEFRNYNVRFKTMGGVRQSPPQLPPPQLSVVSGQLTVVIGSTVPGSAIFYTLDGTNPSPRNPAAQLLVAPVAVSIGTTITARAWLAGYLASETATITA